MAAGGEFPKSKEDYPFDLAWISHLLDEDDQNGQTSTQVQKLDWNSAPDVLWRSLASLRPKRPTVLNLEGSKSSAAAAYTYEINSSTVSEDIGERWDNFSDLAALWETPRVSAYAKLPTQALGHIFFYVDGGSKSWEPGVHLKTTVVDPNNCPVFVLLRNGLLPFSTRHIGTFLALIPGNYTVAVTDGPLNVPVAGSPFTIIVSRNYYMFHCWGPPRVFSNDFVKPWGVAYSNLSKKIYLTDRGSHNISIYSSDKCILEKKFGIKGPLPQAFYRPTGIAVDDKNERLVITDKDNHRVCVYTLQGKFLFAFGNKGFKNGEFNYPWGIAVSPKDSTIAVADSRNHRIQFFDANGNYLRKYSVYETAPFEYKTEFNFPRGIAYDLTGENIFVTDFNNQSIFKLNSALTEKTDITPKGVFLNRPQGIAVDPAGNIIFADSRFNYVRVMNPEGELVASIPGHQVSSFSNPQDVAILPNGEIVVIGDNSKITIL